MTKPFKLYHTDTRHWCISDQAIVHFTAVPYALKMAWVQEHVIDAPLEKRLPAYDRIRFFLDYMFKPISGTIATRPLWDWVQHDGDALLHLMKSYAQWHCADDCLLWLISVMIQSDQYPVLDVETVQHFLYRFDATYTVSALSRLWSRRYAMARLSRPMFCKVYSFFVADPAALYPLLMHGVEPDVDDAELLHEVWEVVHHGALHTLPHPWPLVMSSNFSGVELYRLMAAPSTEVLALPDFFESTEGTIC